MLLSGGCQYIVITAGLFLQPQQVGYDYSFMVLYFTSLVSGAVWDMANGLMTQNNFLKYMMEGSSECMGLVCNPKDGDRET